MAILFISGINDLSTIGISLDDRGNPVYLFDGNCSVHHRIPLKNGIALSLDIFGKGVRQRGVSFKEKPSLIFNQIAEADTHRGALERCIELCARVRTPLINHPQSILQTTRDRVSETLQGIPAVTVPRTVRFNPGSPSDVFDRAEEDRFGMPFIVRVAGLHGGQSMVRVGNREDYPELHALPFDGRDFYLTEFVDCRDDSGRYNRQRLVVIDGEPILRGWLYDRNWKVHGASRGYMLSQETWEDDYKRSDWFESAIIPKLKPAVGEIARRLKLEYFGIDCSVDPEGHMLIFEANANMNILTNEHPQMNARMDMIAGKIRAMLERHSGEKVI